MSKSMILKPRVSEKSYALSQNQVYVFEVPTNANKLTVKQAVADQFGVTVLDVNVANVKGKLKRTFRKRGRASVGYRPDTRKAYVTIKAGETIPVFAAVEDDAQKSKATEEKKPAQTTRARKGSK